MLSDLSISKHHLAGLIDLSDPQAGHVMTCPKNQTFIWFKEQLCHQLSVQLSDIHIWAMATRQNKTLRPESILDEFSNDISKHATVSQPNILALAEICAKVFGNSPTCFIYVETPEQLLPPMVRISQSLSNL